MGEVYWSYLVPLKKLGLLLAMLSAFSILAACEENDGDQRGNETQKEVATNEAPQTNATDTEVKVPGPETDTGDNNFAERGEEEIASSGGRRDRPYADLPESGGIDLLIVITLIGFVCIVSGGLLWRRSSRHT